MNKNHCLALIFIIFIFCLISIFLKNTSTNKEKINTEINSNITTNILAETSTETTEATEPTTEYITISQSEYKPNNKVPTYIKLYTDFLNNKTIVTYDNKKIYLNQIYNLLSSSESVNLEYSLFDMNYDNIPELHLRCPWYYVIITVSNNELKLWRDASTYERPLSNGALLYQRDGGAPTHINYQYTTMDFYGNNKYHIDFSKYDGNMNDIYEESDEDSYFINSDRVSKAKWEKETKKFLAINDAPIKWYKITIN